MLKFKIVIPKDEVWKVNIIKSLDNMKEIELTIDDKIEKFETFSSKLKRSEILFNQFLDKYEKSKLSNEDKLDMLEEVLKICEINPKLNYYFLNYFDKCKCLTEERKEEYEKDKEILSETLNPEDYWSLFNKNQSNPAKDIFSLLKMKCNPDNKYKNLYTHFINKQHNLNIPLLEANERIRLILYRRRIAECEINKDFAKIIQKLENYFEKINPQEKEINMKTYYILLNLQKIENDKCKVWFEYYLDNMLYPQNQIEKYKNFFMDYGIKIQANNSNKNEILISNKFESISIKVNDYCLQNLKVESSSNVDTPLDILLQRNESFNYFKEQKRKIIVDSEIYEDFKTYFKEFIHSNLMADVLKDKHQNVLELINSDSFPGLSLDEKFMKAFPLYDKLAQAYTDKDLLVSFISYFPTLINFDDPIDTMEKYINIKNVFFMFNVCEKFIVTLHEIIIHLSFGYLSYLTDGKIESKSPKESKKNKISSPEIINITEQMEDSDNEVNQEEYQEEEDEEMEEVESGEEMANNEIKFTLNEINNSEEEMENSDDKGCREEENEEIKMENSNNNKIKITLLNLKNSEKEIENTKEEKNILNDDNDGGYYFESLLFGDSVKSINFQLIYSLLNGQHFDDTKEEFQNSIKKNFDPKIIKKTGLFGKIIQKYPINFSLFNYQKITCNMRRKYNNFICERYISNFLDYSSYLK